VISMDMQFQKQAITALKKGGATCGSVANTVAISCEKACPVDLRPNSIKDEIERGGSRNHERTTSQHLQYGHL
jgi:hypothetical protein